MLKLKQVINLNAAEWIDSFQSAIALRDVQKIHSLLQALPQLHTSEEMKSILLLSMDAEILLCNIRQELVNQRTSIISQFS